MSETEGDVIAQMRYWLGEIPRDSIDTMGKPILPGDAEWMDANWNKIYPWLVKLYPSYLGDFSTDVWWIVRNITKVDAHRKLCREMINGSDDAELHTRHMFRLDGVYDEYMQMKFH